MDGEVLGGGNMNAVVRVGDTVLRTAGPWTPTVHRLLAHLRQRGFVEAPEPLRVDGGREVLGYVPGTVPQYPMPAWVWAESVLADAARLLRRWHDASAGFAAPDVVWQQPAHEPREVICHNDWSPHNLVFTDGRVIGVIDVDMASPGPRVWDLAYLATRLVPLSRDHPAWDSPAHARRRLAALLAAYGWDGSVGEVLDVAGTRLLELATFSDGKAVELGRPDLHDHAAGYRSDAEWLRMSLRPALHADGQRSESARTRPMTQDEFARWRRTEIDSYAVELHDSGARATLEEARVQAADQLASFLPEGLETDGMHLLQVLDEAGDPVGDLWLGPHPRRDDAGWVYDVEIRAERRGEGFGRRAMLAAEGICRERGWAEIGLNVFGPNATARALYDSLGYRVVNTNLTKRL